MHRRLGLFIGWLFVLSLGIETPGWAGLMPPHSIEKWLDHATDIVRGQVAPGKFTEQRYLCESPMGLPSYECPKTLIEVTVEEVLQGSLRPGDRITIMVDEGLGMMTTISPRFEPDEPVFVLLSDTQPARRLFAVPRVLQGRVYKVVGDMMGKWNVYPDGVLRRGRYDPDYRYHMPWTAAEASGPNPPKEPYRTISRDEYWKIMKQRYGVRTPDEVFEERWAKGEAIPNEGEITLEQMRRVIRRHDAGFRDKTPWPGKKEPDAGYEIREGLVVPVQ